MFQTTLSCVKTYVQFIMAKKTERRVENCRGFEDWLVRSIWLTCIHGKFVIFSLEHVSQQSTNAITKFIIAKLGSELHSFYNQHISWLGNITLKCNSALVNKLPNKIKLMVQSWKTCAHSSIVPYHRKLSRP